MSLYIMILFSISLNYYCDDVLLRLAKHVMLRELALVIKNISQIKTIVTAYSTPTIESCAHQYHNNNTLTPTHHSYTHTLHSYTLTHTHTPLLHTHTHTLHSYTHVGCTVTMLQRPTRVSDLPPTASSSGIRVATTALCSLQLR